MMSGDYDTVIALAPRYDSGGVPELAEPLAWALSASAKALRERADAATEPKRATMLRRAQDYARRADVIRPGLGAAALGDA